MPVWSLIFLRMAAGFGVVVAAIMSGSIWGSLLTFIVGALIANWIIDCIPARCRKCRRARSFCTTLGPFDYDCRDCSRPVETPASLEGGP